MVIYTCFKPEKMRFLTCLITILACLSACQPKNAGTGADSTATSTKDTTTAIIPAGGGIFYKHLKGTLAGQPVTMNLIHHGGGRYSAWYYYDKIGDPISLLTGECAAYGLAAASLRYCSRSCASASSKT